MAGANAVGAVFGVGQDVIKQARWDLYGAAQHWGRPVGCDHGELMDNDRHFINAMFIM